MAESVPTTFNDSTSSVDIKIHTSNLTQNSYGKVSRKTVTLENIIARLTERNQTTFDGITLYHIASLFKEGILDALRHGEAVSMFDIGTLYTNVRGAVDKDMTAQELASCIHLAFTPSPKAEKQVQNLFVAHVTPAGSGRTIRTVQNLKDIQAGNNTLTKGATARITGTALKLGGAKSGIWFTPLDQKQKPQEDRSTWIQAEHITCNLPKTLEFYVPDTLESGRGYRIVLETSIAVNGSTPTKRTVQIVSPVVHIL